MPVKAKGKKGGKGKKKGKNKSGASFEVTEVILKKLLRTYERNCTATESKMSPKIRQVLKDCIEKGNFMVKFILESVPVEKEGDLPVLIEPFLAAIRQERYTAIRDVHFWDYPLTYENMATLALLLEKPFYQIRLLELMDCLVEPYSALRLSRCLCYCNSMTTLILDYNEFGDDGCENLCSGLKGNNTMLSLSLCYCDLRVRSGTVLGQVLSTTAIREMYLDGNNLECEGAIELIKMCAVQADFEACQRVEAARRKEEEAAAKPAKEKGRHKITSDVDSDSLKSPSPTGSVKKKKKQPSSSHRDMSMLSLEEIPVTGENPPSQDMDNCKKKKSKGPPLPPPIGPWVHKLHLADNGIDGFGPQGSNIAPVICMRLFRKLITHSECLQELDLEDNLIGDLAGKEIMVALKDRKEGKLSSMKLRTTHRLNADTFNSIVKLGAGLKNKKRKGKKKKKR